VKVRRFLSNSQALEDVEAGLGFQINATYKISWLQKRPVLHIQRSFDIAS
jgi:hypothetical protein